MLGIGIGARRNRVLAKSVLMDPIDIHELRARGPGNRIEELRLEIMDAVNSLGIGAQGLGGLTTVLDVKIADHPTHAASLPVCMIPNCAATRHAHFVLDGSGPARQSPPSLDDWPDITWEGADGARRIGLDRARKTSPPGNRAERSSTLPATARDAAQEMKKGHEVR